MAELGESADPVALVPGDPAGVQAVAASMSRLGAGLIGAGDGLRRVDTGDWDGEAADAFRRAFDPIPDQWVGTGDAFLTAADALTDYADVLTWAQGEAGAAVQDWNASQAPPPSGATVDPGDAGRAAAVDRLRRARDELRVAGDAATPVVTRARDMAPPMPSVAQQIGGDLGDLAGGAWQRLVDTGQFLWQIDPARFLIEPAAAVEGWKDLGAGVANAAANPGQTIEQALNPRELATNPTRWAGDTLTGLGLSAIGGAGAAGRVGRVTHAAGALGTAGGDSSGGPPVGRFGGLTALEHAAQGGAQIGRPGSGGSKKHIPPREVDTEQEVREIFDELSRGGQRIPQPTFPGEMVLMPDGSRVMFRPHSSSTGSAVAEVHTSDGTSFKVHVPRR